MDMIKLATIRLNSFLVQNPLPRLRPIRTGKRDTTGNPEMKHFLLKIGVYAVLILLALEMMVRVFHLYTEDPPRFIDSYGVEKRVPGHRGYAVTGNRNQNFSAFNINAFGFNSGHEFVPTADSYEVAVVGDSFIEGFHQDYDKSTETKIEARIPGVKVYNFGYAGYDLADQLHLIHAYRETFEKIDEIIIYLNYENDLNRDRYTPNHERIAKLSSPIFRLRDHIKLLSYASKIGILDTFKNYVTGEKSDSERKGAYMTNKMVEKPETRARKDSLRLSNFKSLVSLYGLDKDKTAILLDSRKTSREFIDYCHREGINIIDFSNTFKASREPTTLIYDAHWNDHGRELIAGEIAGYIRQGKNF